MHNEQKIRMRKIRPEKMWGGNERNISRQISELKNWAPWVSVWTQHAEHPAWRMDREPSSHWNVTSQTLEQREGPASFQKENQASYKGARLRIALNFSASTLQGTRKESNSFILPRKMIFFLTHCPIYGQILHSVWGNFHNLNVQSNAGSTEVLHSEREIHGFNKWGFPAKRGAWRAQVTALWQDY